MEYTYTLDGIRKTVDVLKKIFDLIRIVNPLNMVECNLDESTEAQFRYHQYMCYSVWAKTERCENCVSLRALRENVRKTKYEFINKDVYYVVAVPVIIEKERFVLEIVNNVTDDVLVDAIGHNEFVERITQYNAKRYRDPLTDVYNRKYLGEQIFLDAHLEGVRGKLAVAVFNVDNFKIINNTQSQAFGDHVLIRLARFLTDWADVSRGDYIVRWGGDEFLLLMNRVDKGEFQKQMIQIDRALKKEFADITVCVGGASSEEFDQRNVEKLIALAEGRLYSAKENGKDMMVLWE